MLEKNQSSNELIDREKLVNIGANLLYEKIIEEKSISVMEPNYVLQVCKAQFISFTEDLTTERLKEIVEKKDSIFIKRISSLASLMIKLNLIDYQSIETGLSIVDIRSMFAISILETFNSINSIYAKNNPNISLIPDLFYKTINQCIGIVKMLNLGLLSDSFGAWRTLHESICIIKILIDGKEEVQNEYIRHIVYTNAYRGGITDDKLRDEIFLELKTKMKGYDLKSKDMKKFIEYGWIYKYDGFVFSDPSYRLNFRDGVQRCAKLEDFKEWYEIASELSHSSAIFFYSNEEYFLNLLIHGLYEMLVILEEEFYKYYKNKILSMPYNFVVNYNDFKNMLIEIASKQKCIFNKEFFGNEDVE